MLLLPETSENSPFPPGASQGMHATSILDDPFDAALDNIFVGFPPPLYVDECSGEDQGSLGMSQHMLGNPQAWRCISPMQAASFPMESSNSTTRFHNIGMESQARLPAEIDEGRTTCAYWIEPINTALP